MLKYYFFLNLHFFGFILYNYIKMYGANNIKYYTHLLRLNLQCRTIQAHCTNCQPLARCFCFTFPFTHLPCTHICFSALRYQDTFNSCYFPNKPTCTLEVSNFEASNNFR